MSTTKNIAWQTGTGNITVAYDGNGNGTITVTSDANNLHSDRSQSINVRTTDGSITRTVSISQAAKPYIDLSTAVVTASTQTYSGSALTPTPTVTLNGSTVPSTEYDVAYSNNTNAGTATIIVTGKGDYTGTATGSFTINKANPTYTAPTARTGLTYSGGNQYLTTTGSTSDGTIKYSLDGTNWYTTRRQGQNAGSYTSYWKLEGDANHNDVASTSLTTSIAKASRTLSFSDVYNVVAPSGTITKTATPSAGSGDGAVTYSISSTTYATINSSTGAVTAKSSDGSATVTATIAAGTNYLSASASYTLYVFATTHNFAYTGSVQSLLLPPGSYTLQTWGAQGGSNSAYSSYGITAQAGGKGGYSTGVFTTANEKTVYAFVGGQGSSSGNGGWNGGGGGSGSSSYSSGDTYGVSRMGCGGGATDIALTTSGMSYSSYRNNRSSASLLSRIIVAGGGSGGAGCCKAVTTPTTTWTAKTDIRQRTQWTYGGTTKITDFHCDAGSAVGKRIRTKVTCNDPTLTYLQFQYNSPSGQVNVELQNGVYTYVDVPSSGTTWFIWQAQATGASDYIPYSSVQIVCEYETQSSSTSYSYDSQVGYAGGGTTGKGYSSSYYGSQTAAGSNGAFGLGANQTTTNYRFCSGCGGGGWYGGGSAYTDSYTSYVRYMGGGSGWVNTSASASNRPSGYTGLQLDSGTTYDGDTSFPAPGGGNETGHSGNGYARITRIS